MQSDCNKGNPYFMVSGLLVRTKAVLPSFCSKFVPFFLHSAVLPARCYSHGSQESDEEFDARWVTYFNKPDIDAWELRKGINTLVGYDLVPEPKIIDAALRACRRLNDFASAVRILEVVKVGGTALFPLPEPGSRVVFPGFFLLQRTATLSCCQNLWQSLLAS
uniref:Cytochrome c oxidase subunit 5A, mitochondrial n=1 Tax=Taeniopygia guttata TaxID=59729 RepID=A0A674H4P4_TAEGU